MKQAIKSIFECIMGIVVMLGLAFIIILFAYALDPSDSSNPYNIIIQEVE